MTSFGEMWNVILIFGIIWILYTLLIIFMVKRAGSSYLNMNNKLFVGYVGLTIGLVFSALMSLIRL